MADISNVLLQPQIVEVDGQVEITVDASWTPLTYSELRIARYQELKGYHNECLKGGIAWKAKTYSELQGMTYSELSVNKYSEFGSGVIAQQS